MEAKYQKMMGSLGDMVKTEQEVEQGAKLTDVRIPYPHSTFPREN